MKQIRYKLLPYRQKADVEFFFSLQLCTKIMERNANPEWNQVLNLQVKVISSDDEHKITWKSGTKVFSLFLFDMCLVFAVVPIHVRACQTDSV